jgi:hypothetical protein
MELYRAAKGRFDAEDDFKTRSREAVTALQSGDPESIAVRTFAAADTPASFAERVFRGTRMRRVVGRRSLCPIDSHVFDVPKTLFLRTSSYCYFYHHYSLNNHNPNCEMEL